MTKSHNAQPPDGIILTFYNSPMNYEDPLLIKSIINVAYDPYTKVVIVVNYMIFITRVRKNHGFAFRDITPTPSPAWTPPCCSPTSCIPVRSLSPLATKLLNPRRHAQKEGAAHASGVASGGGTAEGARRAGGEEVEREGFSVVADVDRRLWGWG